MIEVESKNLDWDFTEQDYIRADEILKREILPDNIINEKNTFEALIYCLLSVRQRYDLHVSLFTDIKEMGLLEPEEIISKENQWKNILRKRNSFYNKKYDYICNSKDFCQNTDYVQKLLTDIENGREHGEELREELIKGVIGVGYKTASYFLLKLGYPDHIPIDTWCIEFMEHRGINEKLDVKIENRYIPPYKYKKAELELKKIAEKEHKVTPALFTARILSKYSKWSDEIAERYFECITSDSKHEQ